MAETKCPECKRPATHVVSNGTVTFRGCPFHVHKFALKLKSGASLQ